MATASGQVTNAVFGFTSMFINVLKEQRPDEVLVAFDRPEPTFRHEADADVQGQPRRRARHPAPADGPRARGARRRSASRRASSPAGRPTTSSPPPPSRPSAAATTSSSSPATATPTSSCSDPHVKVLYNRRGVSDYALYDEAGIVERTGVTPAQYPRVRRAARRPERQPARRARRRGEDGGQADQRRTAGSTGSSPTSTSRRRSCGRRSPSTRSGSARTTR